MQKRLLAIVLLFLLLPFMASAQAIVIPEADSSDAIVDTNLMYFYEPGQTSDPPIAQSATDVRDYMQTGITAGTNDADVNSLIDARVDNWARTNDSTLIPLAAINTITQNHIRSAYSDSSINNSTGLITFSPNSGSVDTISIATYVDSRVNIHRGETPATAHPLIDDVLDEAFTGAAISGTTMTITRRSGADAVTLTLPSSGGSGTTVSASASVVDSSASTALSMNVGGTEWNMPTVPDAVPSPALFRSELVDSLNVDIVTADQVVATGIEIPPSSESPWLAVNTGLTDAHFAGAWQLLRTDKLEALPAHAGGTTINDTNRLDFFAYPDAISSDHDFWLGRNAANEITVATSDIALDPTAFRVRRLEALYTVQIGELTAGNVTTARELISTGITIPARPLRGMLLNLGSTGSAQSDRQSGHWIPISLQDFLQLPAHSAGEAIINSGGNRNREDFLLFADSAAPDESVWIGRTSANEMLITSDDTSIDFHDLEVREIISRFDQREVFGEDVDNTAVNFLTEIDLTIPTGVEFGLVNFGQLSASGTRSGEWYLFRWDDLSTRGASSTGQSIDANDLSNLLTFTDTVGAAGGNDTYFGRTSSDEVLVGISAGTNDFLPLTILNVQAPVSDVYYALSLRGDTLRLLGSDDSFTVVDLESESGISAVATDATLTGDGTTGDPLEVANPFTSSDETNLGNAYSDSTYSQSNDNIFFTNTSGGTDTLDIGALRPDVTVNGGGARSDVHSFNFAGDVTGAFNNNVYTITFTDTDTTDPFDLHDDVPTNISSAINNADLFVLSREAISGDPMQNISWQQLRNEVAVDVQSGGTDIVASASAINFSGTGVTVTANGLTANVAITAGSGGGTTVVANPSGTDGVDLTRVTIGSDNYNIAAGGGTGDITGVTAGTGLTGGGDSGAVTLNVENPFTDADETKLDGIAAGAQVGDITSVTAGSGLSGGSNSGIAALAVTNPFTGTDEVWLDRAFHSASVSGSTLTFTRNDSTSPLSVTLPSGGVAGMFFRLITEATGTWTTLDSEHGILMIIVEQGERYQMTVPLIDITTSDQTYLIDSFNPAGGSGDARVIELTISKDATGRIISIAEGNGTAVTIGPIYGIAGGAAGADGTIVTANPSGTDGSDLDRITIGGTNYNIPSGGGGGSGEDNVQADWDEADTTSDAFIENKPPTITAAQTTKLDGIAAGAEVNVGVEYTQTEKTKLAGIETSADVTDRANVYDVVKDIIVGGSNITATDDDTNETVTIVGQAGGGGTDTTIFEGDWVSGTSYSEGDIVESGGELWIARQDTSTVSAPSYFHTHFWRLAPNNNWLDTASSATVSYREGAIVQVGTDVYIALSDNTIGSASISGSSNWAHLTASAGGSGDITAVSVGQGLGGGGTTGAVTITLDNEFTGTDETRLDTLWGAAFVSATLNETQQRIDFQEADGGQENFNIAALFNADSFFDLDGVDETDFTNQANEYVKVNSAETDLIFDELNFNDVGGSIGTGQIGAGVIVNSHLNAALQSDINNAFVSAALDSNTLTLTPNSGTATTIDFSAYENVDASSTITHIGSDFTSITGKDFDSVYGDGASENDRLGFLVSGEDDTVIMTPHATVKGSNDAGAGVSTTGSYGKFYPARPSGLRQMYAGHSGVVFLFVNTSTGLFQSEPPSIILRYRLEGTNSFTSISLTRRNVVGGYREYRNNAGSNTSLYRFVAGERYELQFQLSTASGELTLHAGDSIAVIADTHALQRLEGELRADINATHDIADDLVDFDDLTDDVHESLIIHNETDRTVKPGGLIYQTDSLGTLLNVFLYRHTQSSDWTFDGTSIADSLTAFDQVYLGVPHILFGDEDQPTGSNSYFDTLPMGHTAIEPASWAVQTDYGKWWQRAEDSDAWNEVFAGVKDYAIRGTTNRIERVDMGDASVGQAELVDSAVNSAKVENNTLTANDLAANSVGTSELAANAVTSAKVLDNTLTHNDIGAGAIRTSEILDGTIANDDLNTALQTAISNASNAIGDLRDEYTTELATLNNADRFFVSDESDSGDPVEHIEYSDMRDAIRPSVENGFTDLTDSVNNISFGARLTATASGNNVTVVGDVFDLDGDVSDTTTSLGLNDVVLVGDDSVSGKPNRKVIFSNFVSGVSSRLNLDSSHLQDNSVGASELADGAVDAGALISTESGIAAIIAALGLPTYGDVTEVTWNSLPAGDDTWYASGFTVPASADDDDIIHLSVVTGSWSGNTFTRTAHTTGQVHVGYWRENPAETASGSVASGDFSALSVPGGSGHNANSQILFVGRTASNQILFAHTLPGVALQKASIRIIST